MNVIGGLVEQAGDVLAGGDAADWTGEDVVEHQGGNAELCQGAAHGFLDDAIHAAADEHAAAFHVDGADCVGKQHDPQDEPGRGLADVALGFTTGVVGGGCEIVENDGGSAPEGNETQQRGGRDQYARNSVPLAARGSRVLGSAAH